MRTALALICKGSNDEALLLDRCLKSTAPYVDGIFITRTQKKDEAKNSAVANIATNYGAHLSDFTWTNDFSEARNFNFAQVPKDYDFILWCDADDIWRGLEDLKPTLKKNPSIDGMGFWYVYEWDQHNTPVVVHRKTQLIKNDGCATWQNAIHEDLQPNRIVDIALVEGIERLHLTTAKRAADNAVRNLEIAKKAQKARPEDPRSYWDLANANFSVSDFDGARKAFEEFMETSQSPEEVYLARMRLANVYKSLGKREECLKQLQAAIGLFPTLPDAYFQIAGYYFDFDNLDKAEEYCLQGMKMRPQIMKMVVFNPRDYDVNPMVLLASIYQQKYRPHWVLTLIKGCLKIYPKDKRFLDWKKQAEKEKAILAKALVQVKKLQKIKDKDKLRKALDKLPVDLQSEPFIVQIRNQNFTKTESTGRDLVIYCGNTIEQWSSDTFKTKMVGGSEEAVIQMAREYAKLGWNVTVYNNCGHKPVHDGWYQTNDLKEAKFVTYRPFWEFNYRDKQDVVILWRWCKPLDADINAPKIFVDLHDVISEGELTESRLKKVTKIFVKSHFHRSLFPNTPDNKFCVIGNGVDFHRNKDIKRDPYLILNTSSPDRSMDVMPRLFAGVKKQVPKAKMKWCYGWEGFASAHERDPKKMQWMETTKKAIADAGIESLGRLPQSEVGELYQKASVFAYPTEFAEIDCISVKKAKAANCQIVTTDFGALGERVKGPLVVHSTKTKDTWNKPYQFHFGLEGEEEQQQWIDNCVKALQNPRQTLQPLDETWEEVASYWNNHMQ